MHDQTEQIAKYEGYAAADPDNALIWISLGDLYHRAGRFDDARASFEKAIIAEPANVIAQGRLASVQISRHDFSGAAKVLSDLIESGETDPVLEHNLGICLLHQRQFADALAAFDRAGNDLDAPDTAWFLAQAYHQTGEGRKAVAYAKEWAAAKPGPRTEGYLSLLEFDLGDVESARPRAQAVLEQDPANPEASVVIGTWMAEQQEIEDAEGLFNNVTSAEPDNPRGWIGLGLVSLYQQDYPLALERLSKARACQPDNVGIVTTIGWAQLLSGETEAAEQTYREAIEVDRNFGEAHGGLALALAAQGKEEEARGEIRRARGLDPVGFGFQTAESVLLSQAGKQDAAELVIQSLLERRLSPDSPSLMESVQTFVRKQAARAMPPPKQD